MYRIFLVAAAAFLFVSTAVAQPDSAPYRVFFSSDRDTEENWQLYTMNSDGTGVRRLLESDADDYGAVVSPDGTRLAFTRRDEMARTEIHLLRIDTGESTFFAAGAHPTWSPDGAQIAFSALDGANAEVFIVDADGFNQRRLTNNEARDFAPSWSPDGGWIAFKSDRGEEVGLYVVRVDGTELRRLASAESANFPPSWSPDGTQLLYSRKVEGVRSVHIVNLETGESRRLTSENISEFAPVWSPDGQSIVFTTIIDGQPDIFRMSVDGTGRVPLTNTPAWDWYPTVTAFVDRQQVNP